MQYREPSNIGSMRAITPAVKVLLIVNVTVFLLEAVFRIPLTRFFALSAEWYRHLAFGQLFTYMFVHANLTHLLMNMLGLFFLGPVTERTMGSYRFLVMYIMSGILGGLGWSLLAPGYTHCLGASGAVMGVLGAFAAFYPNATLLLWLVIPVKAWLLVIILAIWELSETIGNAHIGGIANAAHLAGGIAGYVYALTLSHPNLIRLWRQKFRRAAPPAASTAASATGISRAEIDRILDKIGSQGMGALTHREREMLKQATRN